MSSALTLDRPTGLTRPRPFGREVRPGAGRASAARSSTIAESADTPAADQSDARMALLNYAAGRLEALRDRGISDLALSNTYLALHALVGSDAATPQVGVDGEGGVETEWLVDGQSLILNCDADGQNVLWALDDNCQLQFRAEFNARMMDGRLRSRARQCIEQMNRGVRNTARSN